LTRLFQGEQSESALTLLFAVLGLVALALVVWRLVPETKGRTLEEIERSWPGKY